MHTTLYLVRNGATDWSRDGRLAGRRDLSLSTEGRAQAEDATRRLAGLDLAEVLSSPLPRAVETAEAIAKGRLEVARDPRLTDFDAGRWEGMKQSEIVVSDEYKRFIANPLAEAIPGGERLTDARDRMVASIEQALGDNELGAAIVVVSHAGPLRVLIAHYLGMDLASYHRLRLQPTSVTALRFDTERGVPRVLALNCLADVSTINR
ncbi:MAG: histidine phosphatase family protein [Polyangia bacterium]